MMISHSGRGLTTQLWVLLRIERFTTGKSWKVKPLLPRYVHFFRVQYTVQYSHADKQVFDRHQNLSGNQIINYKVSPDGQWLVLVGISSNPDPSGFKIKGALQLYSVERGVSQPIEGHAAAFATLKMDGAPQPTKLFTFAVRTATGATVSSLTRAWATS
jgi:hypothetical protein